MQLLINHLTRMSLGYICVAGLDLATGRHVRPMLRTQMTTKLLARNGGPFDIGEMVDLGRVLATGKPPEVEDYLFDPAVARRIRRAEADELWERLMRCCQPCLEAIFGPALGKKGGKGCGTDQGQGVASLGCLQPRACSQLHVRNYPGKPAQVRVNVSDGLFDLDLRVTDIRLYGPDHVTPDLQMIYKVERRHKADIPVILSVGLGRPFQGSQSQPTHWLQVNNLHLPDDPLWQLG